jgi:hypothetical protein
VPGTGIYYRNSGTSNISFIGCCDKKKDSLLLSMKLHMKYLRSLEESDRVRKACLAYIRIWLKNFYPERPDIIAELEGVAKDLGEDLGVPRLRWKYTWLQKVFGYSAAKRAQTFLPQVKASFLRSWDRALFSFES